MQKPRFARKSLLAALGCLSVCGFTSPGLLAADSQSALTRAASQHPTNLARTQSGVRLSVFNAQGQPAANARNAATALLTDSDPLGYALETGRTTMILALANAEELQVFNFLNLSAAGQVSLSVSNSRLAPDSPRWRSVINAQEFSEHDVINCELGRAEARYVKLDFQVTKAGSIDTFGLFSNRVASSLGSATMRPTGNRFLGYDFVDYGGATAPGTVVMVSPGDDLNAAQAMVDGNLRTGYTFKAADHRPMAVLDLGTPRTIRRISVAYRAGAGRLDFFLLTDPSQRNGWLQARNGGTNTAALQQIVGSNFPGSRQATASVRTTGATGLQRANVNATGENGRYLVMIFTPNSAAVGGSSTASNPPSRVDPKDFKDGVPPSSSNAEDPASPFSISEITFIGPPGTPTSIVPDLPPVNPAPPLFPPGGTVTP